MNNQNVINNSGFEIKYCHEKYNSEWDAFVNEMDGEIQQSSVWANHDFTYHKWKAVRFYIKNGETIVAGCQISIINDYLMGNVGIINSGPIFRIKTPELMSLIVKEIKKCSQVMNLSFLMIRPDYNEHDLVPFLENEDFKSNFPYHLPYRNINLCSFYLDLHPSIDDLFKKMSKSRKKFIKRGLDSPVKVKIGGRDDLNVFYELFKSIISKHTCLDPITNKTVELQPYIEYDELCNIWDELSPYGWVKLFLGTVENEVICGELIFTFGKTVRGDSWGWNGKFKEYHISDMFQWEIIKWAKTNGFDYYDFGSIDGKIAEAFLSSQPIPEEWMQSSKYGPTVFKCQFNGKVIKYPNKYYCYSDRWKQIVETSSDDLVLLLKRYNEFYWGSKNFFREH